MAAGGRRRGALEQEVLGSLAAAGRPLTVAEVLADLDDGLAYTTVMTALSRLHAKGALSREPVGRAFAYALAADPTALEASLTARRMSRLLDAGHDRADVLARFVADLGPADEQVLTELLAGDRRDGTGPDGTGPEGVGPEGVGPDGAHLEQASPDPAPLDPTRADGAGRR